MTAYTYIHTYILYWLVPTGLFVSLNSLKFKPILLGRGVPRVKINKGIVN